MARSCDVNWGELNHGIKTLETLCDSYDQPGIVAELNRLVPEMQRCLGDEGQVVADQSVAG